MKNILKPAFALAFLAFSLSACTAGDKGSEKVPDSVSIDTTKSSMSTGGASESVDSSSMDTASKANQMNRDTTQKDRSGNSAADYKPKK